MKIARIETYPGFAAQRPFLGNEKKALFISSVYFVARTVSQSAKSLTRFFRSAFSVVITQQCRGGLVHPRITGTIRPSYR